MLHLCEPFCHSMKIYWHYVCHEYQQRFFSLGEPVKDCFLIQKKREDTHTDTQSRKLSKSDYFSMKMENEAGRIKKNSFRFGIHD